MTENIQERVGTIIRDEKKEKGRHGDVKEKQVLKKKGRA